jgi:SAM-dependent methyltransferase
MASVTSGNAFADPRVAGLYDAFDHDRSDLAVHVELVAELLGETGRVLDVGCGTGTLACLLALRGYDVVGNDPAKAMLDVARTKAGADRVQWIRSEAAGLPTGLRVDLAVLTGNVAQVFVGDEEWAKALEALRRVVVKRGFLVFETRIPEVEAWRDWVPERSRSTTEIHGQVFESWYELVDASRSVVTFRDHTVWPDGSHTVAESTLRFREKTELERSLHDAGFVVAEIREAPDRPGREWVFVATARTTGS